MPVHPVQIGPYRILGLLGRGTSSDVYRADRPESRTQVALKVLRPGRSRREREAFAARVRSASGLDDPRLVRVLDSSLSEDPPWVALELVEGESLEHLLRTAQTRLLRILPRMTKDLLGALEALASAGATHGDLTTGNVLVTRDDRARLLDLGRGERRTSTIEGTPAYLAPEVLHGDPATGASDLYQLGALLYEVIAGFVPHADLAPNFLAIRRDRSVRATPLDTLATGASTQVARLVDSLLDPDPGGRPALAEVARRIAAIPAPWVHRPPVAQVFDARVGQVGPSLGRARGALRRSFGAPDPVFYPADRETFPRRHLIRVAGVLLLSFLMAGWAGWLR